MLYFYPVYYIIINMNIKYIYSDEEFFINMSTWEARETRRESSSESR